LNITGIFRTDIYSFVGDMPGFRTAEKSLNKQNPIKGKSRVIADPARLPVKYRLIAF
jgi:hypothetical protein